MPGCLYKLEELSSPTIAALDRQTTAFFIPISPLEGHGPHLPLGVDFFDAQFFARNLAELLRVKHPEFDSVLVPPIPLGAQVYKQPGSIRTNSRALYKVAYGLGESLASWGFRYMFLLSGHGSPRHIVTLESACIKISKKYDIQMHNLSGALAIRFLRGEFVDRISARLSKPLTSDEKELLAADIHGGWWETSMMLYLHPELVGEYKNLETVKRSEKDPARKRGYYGSPALASREFAEVSLDVMTEEAVGIIDRILTGNNVKSDTVSFLYKMPLLRPYSILRLAIFLMVFTILTLLAIIMLK
jgi:creatinine amidohydrolase